MSGEELIRPKHHEDMWKAAKQRLAGGVAEAEEGLREMRRLPKSAHLSPVPKSEWPAHRGGGRPPVEVYWSKDYLVQVYHEGRNYRLSVCRTQMGGDGRWVDGISWGELQRLKREAGFGDHWAVEIYPADLDVVNVANMRHLWVLAEAPAFGWRRQR